MEYIPEVSARLDPPLENHFENRLENHFDNRLDSRLENRLENRLDSRLDSRLDNRLDNRLDSRLDNRLHRHLDRASAQDSWPTKPVSQSGRRLLERKKLFPIAFMAYKNIDRGTFECTRNNCGKRFSRFPDLRRHHITVHEKAQLFFCSEPNCKRHIQGFSRKDKRDSHQKSKHNLIRELSTARIGTDSPVRRVEIFTSPPLPQSEELSHRMHPIPTITRPESDDATLTEFFPHIWDHNSHNWHTDTDPSMV